MVPLILIAMRIPNSFSMTLLSPAVSSRFQSIYVPRLPRTGFLHPRELDTWKEPVESPVHTWNMNGVVAEEKLKDLDWCFSGLYFAM